VTRALSLLAVATVAFAGHEAIPLDGPAEVAYAIARDCDGDGRDDIVAVARGEVWYWRGRGGPFAAAPDARVALPEGTALFDLGPTGEGNALEFVARTAAGYWALPFHGDPRRLPHASGPGLPPRPQNLLWRGLFCDLDRDGKPDFVDTSLAGYTLTFSSGGTVTLPPELDETCETSAEASSERLVARHAFGLWLEGNFDGDLRPDFAVLTRTGLVVYPGDAEGRFDPARRFDLPFEEAADADLNFVDLNGDGRTDLVAVRRKEGKIHVLVADPRKGLREAHRIRLTLPGDMRHPVIDDLDGDGLPDLAFPYVARPTIQDAVRVVARGEVIVLVPIFVNQGGRACIPMSATSQVAVPIRVRVATDEAGRIRISGLVIVEYGGDFDGDGRKDLLVTEGTKMLAVHRGAAGIVFREETAFRIEVPDCADFDSVKSTALDVDGDGCSDLLLHYRGAGRRPDRLYLLRSGKR